MNFRNLILVGLVAVVILGGAAFFVGSRNKVKVNTPVSAASAVLSEETNKIALSDHEAANKKLPAADAGKNTAKVSSGRDDKFDGVKIVKTDAEWRAELIKQQFYVLREKGTERAYTGEFTDNHEPGDYYCAGCHLKLFSSKSKFESGTGWASFFEPLEKLNVTEVSDDSLGETRTEVTCSRCDSHLGHVFDDGPQPTGLRYCINSAALGFQKKN